MGEAIIYVEEARERRGKGGATRDSGIWFWTGDTARFVEYGGHRRAEEFARDAGLPLALWGEPYGYPGVPKDAPKATVERCIAEAAERARRRSG
ncbi:MAG: hypothetical protein ACLGG9_04580 [Thermoleophilia bacterium]